MSDPTELRARAAELEDRVPPVTAGPRTDDERMWLEKATALRAEAEQREAPAMWTCESCENENQAEDEHCQTCDIWRSEQEDTEK